MSLELLLSFSDTNELTVTFDGESSSPIAFQNPITAAEFQEVRWYLETYGAQYTADVDDDRANGIAVSLKKFGIRLFEAAFAERSGMRLFDRFLAEDEAGRLVTVQSVQPEILGLPWELLHQPGGAYVFNEKPRISIRRNLAGSRGGRAPKRFKPKATLRVVMVVSRPSDAGFIDPFGESRAVLDAIDQHGEGRIAVEFLRPGTLAGLERRLENDDLPRVDILHFDGHGVFEQSQNVGYLLFEKADRTKDLVAAERLGELLNQQGLGLVVLSACQSSMIGQENNGETGAIGSVAARLTQTGVQSVVAMSYSVLVKTTEMLFGSFYRDLVRGKGIGESLDNARRSLMVNPERGALMEAETWALNFAEYINRFLAYLGMNAERADLSQRVTLVAQVIAVGSHAWFLARSNAGEQLLHAGQPQVAIEVFEEIFTGLAKTVSYERSVTRNRQGRCNAAMGKPEQAILLYYKALDDLAQLDLNVQVQRLMGVTQVDLADQLMVMRDYETARKTYEASLVTLENLNDMRSIGVVNFQLSILALKKGTFDEAEIRSHLAIKTFSNLNEPDSEAHAWHQLGMVYQTIKKWDESEKSYRIAAQMKEAQGDFISAAMTWNNLAVMLESTGNHQEAEAWYRKALKVDREIGNMKEVAIDLNNLANILQIQGADRLPEACKLAEEALALKQTIDPAAAEIWKSYGLLAQIATQQGAAAKAQNYRRLSRQSYAAFAGSRYALQKWEELIQGIVVAVGDADVRQQVEDALPELPVPFATAIWQILAGGQDEDGLCAELDYGQSLIVGEILRRL